MKQVKISEIAQVQFGLYAKHVEKGKGKHAEQGKIKYLQAKHFDDAGVLNLETVDSFLHKDEQHKTHLLDEGDVLFAGKGVRNFARIYTFQMGDAIASSNFFILHPNQNEVFPAFLATLFNMPKYQSRFQSMREGGTIASIRKSELEAVTINLPDLEMQQKIMTLKRMHQQDMQLSKKIIEEKEIRLQSVINQLLNI